MIFTCDACNYTFTDSTLPDSCPDCGKRTVKSQTDKYITVPAVRPATKAEIAWYNEIQAELNRRGRTAQGIMLTKWSVTLTK